MATKADPFVKRARSTEPRLYDFRIPEGLDRAHIRSLSQVFDIYVRFAGGVLTGSLRMPVHVKVMRIEQSSWEDFARASESPAHLIVFSMSPLPAKSILYIPLDLAMAMVDVRLSGPGSGWYPKRALTEIEEVLLAPIVDSLLSELGNALSHYIAVNIAINQKAADTDLLQAVITSGYCVIVYLEVRFGDGGVFTAAVCLPFPVVRPIVETIEKSNLARADTPDEPDPALVKRLLRIPIDVSVRFPSPKLSPPEIASLQPGDVIPLHHQPGKPLTMLAGGKPKFSVLPTAVGRHLAALVIDPDTVDEIWDDSEEEQTNGESDWTQSVHSPAGTADDEFNAQERNQ